MKIVNKSTHNIVVRNETAARKVAPKEEINVPEYIFNTQSIHSDAGSIEITTEYSKRSFDCYGGLKAYENKQVKDDQGLPEIIVVDADLNKEEN